jgi:two-component system, NarL family, invasion response regulator UvrY
LRYSHAVCRGLNTLMEQRLRILIADDHDIVRQGLRQLLEEEFPTVQLGEAVDTGTLIELANSSTWDIIVSDLVMPGGGGFYALEKIKESQPDIPFVILSTHPAEQYAQRATKAGATCFINKSSLPSGLVNAIQDILEKKNNSPQFSHILE